MPEVGERSVHIDRKEMPVYDCYIDSKLKIKFGNDCFSKNMKLPVTSNNGEQFTLLLCIMFIANLNKLFTYIYILRHEKAVQPTIWRSMNRMKDL